MRWITNALLIITLLSTQASTVLAHCCPPPTQPSTTTEQTPCHQTNTATATSPATIEMNSMTCDQQCLLVLAVLPQSLHAPALLLPATFNAPAITPLQTTAVDIFRPPI